MRPRILLLIILALFLVALSAAAQDATTYYVNVRSAKVRAEPSTTASVVTTLRRNDSLSVFEEVEGTRVSGSKVWYRISVNGLEGYIHSSLVTDRAPVVVSTPIPSSGGGGSSGGASCGGASTCSQMTSCDQAYACLAAGRSSLDRDKDGVPCESICPGG